MLNRFGGHTSGELIPWGKPRDIQFPANCAENGVSRVMRRHLIRGVENGAALFGEVSVWQTLGQAASFRQTAPETRCQSRVCSAFPAASPKRLISTCSGGKRNRFGETHAQGTYPVGQTLGKPANSWQTRPETHGQSGQSRVCSAPFRRIYKSPIYNA